MLRILCSLFALLACSGHATTLLVYGDSLSAGYQLPTEKSWPALLAADWKSQGLDLHIVNASVSGETTQGGLARLSQALQTHVPDWVLLELGANDGLRGLPPSLTRKNLDQMLQRIQQQGARALLIQIRIPPNYGARYIRQFESIYPELAQQHQVPLLPFFMEPIITDPALLLADGLHPNARGQEKIRDQLEPILTPLLTPP
jgi:acyl-CoA thioesterase-1